MVVAGEEEIDLSCGRNKKNCYGLLVSEGFGSLLLLQLRHRNEAQQHGKFRGGGGRKTMRDLAED
jgi:hypothetical protein